MRVSRWGAYLSASDLILLDGEDHANEGPHGTGEEDYDHSQLQKVGKQWTTTTAQQVRERHLLNICTRKDCIGGGVVMGIINRSMLQKIDSILSLDSRFG
jgi:hypothetical protein